MPHVEDGRVQRSKELRSLITSLRTELINTAIALSLDFLLYEIINDVFSDVFLLFAAKNIIKDTGYLIHEKLI